MESNVARNRAELSGKATNVLDFRTLASSHKRLAELLTEGMTVLDVGCGAGAITHGIAKIVGPTGRVVGIDSNPALIEKAKKTFGDIPGLEFECGDIFNLHFKEEFDIVTSARVLQWLSNPLEALTVLKSSTKPGGRVLILDYNHEKISWEPVPPSSMKSFYSAFLKWRSDAGMDNAIADHLPNLFEKVGINEIIITPQHETVKRTDNDFNSRISIWADVAASRGIQMVKDRYITESQRATAEMEYREWINEVAMSQTMYLLAVEGRKNNL
ncbi:methyltransferase domain-containing protein [Paenibacillus sedimenti]|uniref:Methyltransferase domain-containing protein n=1 Tax=Paenibacillus sedimenti TaxID=2770274 RepID=A0A926KTD8_9BACL|nr:methyltransferase domain-containing protein [Paenibacillus sedimenti]MBD0383670.1 methyltransferase domain-containing protein [Paenibacillus sedimenti]